MQDVPLIPPLAGVDRTAAYSDTPPGRARDALNVVSVSYQDQQTRLSKRPGWSRFNASQISTSGKVAEIAQVVSKRLNVNYTSVDPIINYEQKTRVGKAQVGTANAGGYQVVAAPYGDIYVLQHNTSVFYRFNQDGALISSTAVPVEKNGTANVIAVDDQYNVFVGLADQTVGAGQPVIWRFQLQPAGNFAVMWTITDKASSGTNTAMMVRAMEVRDGVLYTTEDNLDSSVANRRVRLRGYSNIYALSGPQRTLNTALVTELFGSPYATVSFVRPNALCLNSAGEILVTGDEIVGSTNARNWLIKLTAKGDKIWAHTVNTLAGMGSAVRVTSGDNIFTVGDPIATGTDDAIARYFLDNGSGTAPGSTAALTSSDGWPDSFPGTGNVRYLLAQVDAFDNLHFCLPRVLSTANGTPEYWCVDANLGEVQTDATVPPPVITSYPAGVLTKYIGPGAIRSVALSVTNPDYSQSSPAPDRAEHVWVTGEQNYLYQLLLVRVSSKTGTNRAFSLVALADNSIYTVTSLTSTQVKTSLNPGYRYAQIATLFSKAYITTGLEYWVYDADAGTVKAYKSSTSGTIPRRCQLIEPWRGRIVLSGDPDNRHIWYMSAMGEPTDWDLFPPVVTSTVAIAGTNAPALRDTPEIIQSIVPWSNDWLLFGGDHSLHLLRGDPAQGGTLDMISNTVGMAFGRPWCIGPNGVLFWFANRGGVYMMAPGDVPQPLSRDRLKAEFDGIDLEAYYARMVWDHEREGLWLMFCPYGSGGTVIKYYFWSARTDAWWPMQTGVPTATRNQPTAVFSVDGDLPDDRLLLIGTEQGYINKLDTSSTMDVTDPIDSYLLLGPWVGADGVRELTLRDLWATLDRKYQGLHWEVYVSDSPEILPDTPVANGVFAPGRNQRAPVRRRGGAMWIKVYNSGINDTFAIETMTARMGYGARVRV